MKIAFECPTPMLEDIQPLGDFDFTLTHLVLGDPEYAAFYAASSRFKILDNSTNELLEPCSVEDIKKAYKVIRPDIVVAPDYLGDAERTLKVLEAFLGVFSIDQVIPVVQGKDHVDCYRCLDKILKMGFDIVAVPYDLTCVRTDSLNKMASCRLDVVRYAVHQEFRWIHLLGLTRLSEIDEYKFQSQVGMTVDTGMPIMLGQKFLGLDQAVDKSIPTLNRIDKGSFDIRQMAGVYRNIADLRRHTNDVGRNIRF